MSRVNLMSASDGVGSPLGWLCARNTADALAAMAGRNTSRGCVTSESSVPRASVSTRMSRRLVFTSTTVKCSTSSSRLSSRSRPANFSGVSSTGDSWRSSSARRLARLNALFNVTALSRPTPFTHSSSMGALARASSEPNLLSSDWATSIADKPCVPVRSKMAINSLSLSASAPLARSRSRGFSLSGRSLIRVASGMRFIAAQPCVFVDVRAWACCSSVSPHWPEIACPTSWLFAGDTAGGHRPSVGCQ